MSGSSISRVWTAEQPADHDQVLGAGQLVVYRGVLAGQRDELADLNRVGDDVVATDPGVPGVGLQQGGQHPHRGGLAGPVRAEQGQHAAPLRRDVHPGQRLGVPEALGQPLGLDHVAHPCPTAVGHPSLVICTTTVAHDADRARPAR
jgi:hypothetical protein